MECKDQRFNPSKELSSLIQKKYNKLYSVVYRMTNDHKDTEDVLQNTFVKAIDNMHNFRQQSEMYTWVYRIAINESCRFLKSISRLPIVGILEKNGMSEETFFNSLQYTPSYDDNLIVEEMREMCLHGFLKCIPQPMRISILLKGCLQLKTSEIAAVMEMTEENVKVTLHRARKRLAEMFEMRCSLIDSKKQCKCYLWIKYMRDNNLPLPQGHYQYKNRELEKEHFKKMSALHKIDYLYTVEEKLTKEEFIGKLKKVVAIL
jgi:RNA polymerase sigma-70 factor (ECF subfamily)